MTTHIGASRASRSSDIPESVSPSEFCRLAGPVMGKPAGIHLTTYYRLAAEGRMPRARRGIPRSEVQAWLDARAAETAAAAASARRELEGGAVLSPDANSEIRG
jgi:predicted DNA-binding transcriptional regulator AlpA